MKCQLYIQTSFVLYVMKVCACAYVRTLKIDEPGHIIISGKQEKKRSIFSLFFMRRAIQNQKHDDDYFGKR